MDAHGTATTTGGTAIEETIDRLIASDKVERTVVYNRRGERSARCTISWSTSPPGELPTPSCLFGGFLGMGESYHPLPRRVLNYDTRQHGFVIDLDRSRIEEAPSHMASNVWNWSYRDLRQPDRRVLRRAVLLDHDLIGSQNGFGQGGR
jgi:hypothetical protein